MGTRCADHVTPLYPQKLALTSPTGGSRSVGIVRVRTKATEFTVLRCVYVYQPPCPLNLAAERYLSLVSDICEDGRDVLKYVGVVKDYTDVFDECESAWLYKQAF